MWTADAVACDVGPFALEFPAGSSELTDPAKGALEYERSILGTNNQNVIRVAFHGERPRPDTQAAKLRHARAKAIGDYLLGQGVQPSQINIIETGKPAPRIWESRLLDSSVTVELTAGCTR